MQDLIPVEEDLAPRDGTNGNLQDFRITDRIESSKLKIESKNDRIE